MTTASQQRSIYLVPPLVLASWGILFIYLALSGRLRLLLNPLFWPLEQICGGALLGMALVYFLFFRPVSREIDSPQLRAAFSRAALLIGPLLVAVFFAPPSFSAAALEKRAGLAGGRMLAQTSGASSSSDHVELVDLAAAAYYPEHIPSVSGKKVSYVGQYFPGQNGEFRFCRVLMSCCASDATPIYLHIVGNAPALKEMQWISIEGETFFRKDEDGGWIPCVRLGKVAASTQPVDPYLYPVRLTRKP